MSNKFQIWANSLSPFKHSWLAVNVGMILIFICFIIAGLIVPSFILSHILMACGITFIIANTIVPAIVWIMSKIL